MCRNKVDLVGKRVVFAEEGVELAQKYQFPFFEASAKTKVNIKEQFEKLIWEVLFYNHKRLKNNPSTRNKSCVVL